MAAGIVVGVMATVAVFGVWRWLSCTWRDVRQGILWDARRQIEPMLIRKEDYTLLKADVANNRERVKLLQKKFNEAVDES